MALVQDWTPSSGSSGSTRTVNGTGTAAGNFLHITVSMASDENTITSIIDTAGNTWVEAPVAGVRLGVTVQRHFYCFRAQSITSLTVAFSGGGVSNQVFLREFDDDVGQIVAWRALSTEPSVIEIPPAEVTIDQPGTVVIGSLVDTLTNRVYTLQNTNDFTALNEEQNSSLETTNAYGILGAGTWGPEWHITSGTARVVSLLTTAFAPGGDPPVDSLGDKLVYDGAEWRNTTISRFDGAQWRSGQ